MLARFVNSLPNGLSQRLTRLYFQVLLRNQRDSHSFQELHDYNNMEVKILPALQDNYMYLIVDKATKEAAIVDPVEPDTVIEAANKNGIHLTTVLTTHHHWDHAGGNEQLKKILPHLVVYGGDQRIGALTNMVEHNSRIKIGNLNVQCLSTPCHTAGHICYFVTVPEEGNDSAVFTGDTLFLGGCGRFFEGTPEQMYEALISKLANLPEHTKVYCGHEYTLQNLKFASFVDPMNEILQKKMEWSVQRRQDGLPTVFMFDIVEVAGKEEWIRLAQNRSEWCDKERPIPSSGWTRAADNDVPSTIGEEKAYNPFMRVTEPQIMQFAGVQDAIETMKIIRLQKDNFRA